MEEALERKRSLSASRQRAFRKRARLRKEGAMRVRQSRASTDGYESDKEWKLTLREQALQHILQNWEGESE